LKNNFLLLSFLIYTANAKSEKVSYSIDIPDHLIQKIYNAPLKPSKSFADLIYEFFTDFTYYNPKMTLAFVVPVFLKWCECLVKRWDSFLKTINDFLNMDEINKQFSGFAEKITNNEIFCLLADMSEDEFENFEKSKNLTNIISSLNYNEKDQTFNVASLAIVKLYALKNKLTFYEENIKNLESVTKSKIKSFIARLDPITKLLVAKKDLILERINRLITIIKIDLTA
jgi:hypothetical protein